MKQRDSLDKGQPNRNVYLTLDTTIFSKLCACRTSTDRYANVDVGVLLYHMEKFPGIVILTTNLIENLDMAFFRRLQFVLHLEIPRQALRYKLWKVSQLAC